MFVFLFGILLLIGLGVSSSLHDFSSYSHDLHSHISMVHPVLAASHHSIIIGNNHELATFCAINVSRSGTIADPYLISNLSINVLGMGGISITNTTSPLLIHNCSIYYYSNSEFSIYSGIILNNCSSITISLLCINPLSTPVIRNQARLVSKKFSII